MQAIQTNRWIPKGATELAHPDGLGIAYAYNYENGPRKVPTFAVCAYAPKAKKPTFHEAYGRAELRDKRVSDWFAGLNKWQDMKREAREVRGRPHTLKFGDIVVNSWGWEQT